MRIFWALLFTVTLAGVASGAEGVLGPGPGPQHPVGLWRGDRFTAVLMESAPGVRRAVGTDDFRRWGIDGRWALVEFRGHDGPPGSNLLILEELRRLDGTPRFARLDGPMAELERRQTAELGPLVLEAGRGLSMQDGLGVPSTAIKSIEWSGERLRVEVVTQIVRLRFQIPCGGIQRPPTLGPAETVRMRRVYELDRAGRVADLPSPPIEADRRVACPPLP